MAVENIGCGSRSSLSIRYPHARVDDAEDTLAGVSFPDPYRWLENDTQEVRVWEQNQSQLTESHVQAWPQFDRLRRLVAVCSTETYLGGALPRYAAGRWFRTCNVDGGARSQAVVSDEPMGDGRVLFDSYSDGIQHRLYLSWISPSPDGRILAMGICADGSETTRICLVDVDTGKLLADPPPQPIMDNEAAWLPDSSGFFFIGLAGSAVDWEPLAFLHRREPSPSTEDISIAWTESRQWRWITVSQDGRYAVAYERNTNPIPVAVALLGDASPQWRPFITSIKNTVVGHMVGDRYIAVTTEGAPRGRLVSIDLTAGDPDDSECWLELVPESESILRTVTPVDGTLYLSSFVDSYSRIRIVDYSGQALGEVPLPFRGAVGSQWWNALVSTHPKGHPEKFIFSFSSFTRSPGVYSHAPGSDELEVLSAPLVHLGNVVVKDRWATSRDGTQIPYHIVHGCEPNGDRCRPTLLYAYGAYGHPLVPEFPGPMAAFIAAGGAFVHAHVRGGGEFGLDWWHAGRMHNKQSTFDDLYAVAEDLIATRICSPRSLSMTGHSAGGWMAGVAIVQRPDLWKVVVPRGAFLDCLGGCRDNYGRLAVGMEFADVDDPDDVRRLATISPYHLIRDGVSYPAVYLDAGATDPRCPPWHARKFVARLQQATSGCEPILLRVWSNVGHGGATDKVHAVAEHTEWLAFVFRHLGVQDWTESPLTLG